MFQMQWCQSEDTQDLGTWDTLAFSALHLKILETVFAYWFSCHNPSHRVEILDIFTAESELDLKNIFKLNYSHTSDI